MVPPSLSILTEGIVGFTAETHRNGDLFYSSASHEELVSASSKLLVVSQLCGRRFCPGLLGCISVAEKVWERQGNAVVVKTSQNFLP